MADTPVQGLVPNKRSYRVSLAALMSVLLTTLIVGATWSVVPRAHAASYCQVSYTVQSQWSDGFTGSVTITNTSSAAYSSWTLTFPFPNTSQKITQGWNATWSQSGQNVTAASLSYNGSLAANTSTNIGFNGTWSGSNPLPTSFSVNGNVCNGTTGTTPTPGTTPTTTPTPGTTPTTGITPTPTSGQTGNATWYSGIGGNSYGGCGVPQANLDSQNFLALNVQNTSGDYSTFLSRPIAAQYASLIGQFNNGLNCGRWVQVTIGDYCTGVNDGAPNQSFCRNGSWVADKYNGATLNLLVADSCQDGNAWCRDDPYHVDLVQSSLNQFVKNGQPVSDMYPNAWNNRHVSWQFVSAPDYTGDIKIGFLQGANPYWSAISVTHLANGIHGIDYYQNGSWVKATMDSDMGNDYVILPTAVAGSSYQIRVRDSSDQLINGGRIYNFSYPSSCGSSCSAPYLAITYTTS